MQFDNESSRNDKSKLVDDKGAKDIELRDLKEAAKGQHESMGKEVKSIDKKNLVKIKSYLDKNAGDYPITFILDNFTKFLSANKNATYNSAGKDFFVDIETFHDKIREIKVGALAAKDIEEIILKIQGNNGQGEIIQQLTKADKVKEYVDFFCYVKTLLKLCNWSITACRVKQHEKKIANLEKKINDFAAQADRNKAILDSLKEMDALEGMIDFLENTSGRPIRDKQASIEKALRNNREEIENFVSRYFAEEVIEE